MLKHFIRQALNKRSRVFFTKPRIIIGIPSGITGVEKRAVLDAAYQAGASEAYLLEEPMAAAIGASLPVSEPSGSMVVDIGGVQPRLPSFRWVVLLLPSRFELLVMKWTKPLCPIVEKIIGY